MTSDNFYKIRIEIYCINIPGVKFDGLVNLRNLRRLPKSNPKSSKQIF